MKFDTPAQTNPIDRMRGGGTSAPPHRRSLEDDGKGDIRV